MTGCKLRRVLLPSLVAANSGSRGYMDLEAYTETEFYSHIHPSRLYIRLHLSWSSFTSIATRPCRTSIPPLSVSTKIFVPVPILSLLVEKIS